MTYIIPKLALLALAAAAGSAQTDSKVCAGCHRAIWETYQRTGMARSFYEPTAQNVLADSAKGHTYYHKASNSYFEMLRREGQFYQRRYQLNSDGKQVNVMEKRIDYVMGSGNHARTYLSRTAQNTLIELPLAWYAEKGGSLGMNPGYDKPDHEGFRRPITYDCMFCHNTYPQIPAGHERPMAEPVYVGSLPEGIDCQRCHGRGDTHVQLAKTAGTTKDQLRQSIVNPAHLSADRQMEVCMQCHLETTSFPLPNALQRYERNAFSYQPGEPLSDFILNFDHAAGSGREDKFEIVNAAYRLRRSACFLKSKGALRCTTCHNPHDIPRGAEAVQHYNGVCQQCHQSTEHERAGDCISCHMPTRRTEDVVHVVLTDHYIQRRKPAGDLLAEMTERHETDATAYRGAVVPYYPQTLGANDLYLVIAQVIQQSNLKAGIAQLTAALEQKRPKRAEYYFDLAEALRNDGQPSKAEAVYREALRRDAQFVPAMQKLGMTLRQLGRAPEAIDVLRRAADIDNHAITWHELGLSYRATGQLPEAIAAMEKAVAIDPELAEAHNNLGIIWFGGGEGGKAEAAFLEAIRIRPDYADAHGNLGNLLASKGDFKGADEHFRIALRLRPNDAPTRYNYAMALGRGQRIDEAQSELEEALRLDANLADAQLLLGKLLLAKGRAREAIPHLQKAAAGADAAVRDEALETLRQLGK